MAKSKFEITKDLVRLEDEPIVISAPLAITKKEPAKLVKTKERLSADIDSDIKHRLQILAIKQRTNLTTLIEQALLEYIEREK
ncbi:ribbon-helix-helix protein, CopG family [Candidatus Odyssella acanthamoebae]|uniref:Ribbon-helix-helix protein CopG domain-containing protein n=1 Tax=Candidatus Odyssella acanthamoebae TaxID=91604 RepID=A0A077AXH7_9PROT|nr:ribbon-helix-helix protein, CopG family [Candidatus Paracaedibacter acanthamoebae]AIK97301.1 hypothetical protein ID47_11995 [Candidatus Paracaedibacter acanthamoebae]